MEQNGYVTVNGTKLCVIWSLFFEKKKVFLECHDNTTQHNNTKTNLSCYLRIAHLLK